MFIMESIPCAPTTPYDSSFESHSTLNSSDSLHATLPLHRSSSARLRLLSATTVNGSPFRSLRRQRLWTADTIPVQNTTTPTSRRNLLFLSRTRSNSFAFTASTIEGARLETESFGFRVAHEDPTSTPYTMRSDENPFESGDCAEDDDILSTYSSISNDSVRRLIPDIARLPNANTLPPTIISIRIKSTCSSYTSNCDSDDSNETLPPLLPSLDWQKSWTDGGGGAPIVLPLCTSSQRFEQDAISPLTQCTKRPSPVLISSRCLSHDTAGQISSTSHSAIQFRLDAPRNELHKVRGRRAESLFSSRLHSQTPLPVYTSLTSNAVISILPATNLESPTQHEKRAEGKFDPPLSPNECLHRINTVTTASTIYTSPELSPKSAGATTTKRDSFVFRPLMKRACTTNVTHTVIRPVLVPRNQTSNNVTIASGSVSIAGSEQLLGDRPRRKPVHGSESVFSFGSLVGQSSLKALSSTANVSVSEGNQSNCSLAPTTAKEFGQLIKANKRLYQHSLKDGSEIFIPPVSQRRKSGVHQDFEHLWKQIRRFAGTESHLDLKRNRAGCLT